MRVKIYSEMTVQSYAESAPHVLVSITSPDGDRPPLPDNPAREDVLWMQFHDVEDDGDTVSRWLRRNGVAPCFFNDAMALEVAKFISAHPDVEAVVVNCEAGVSRSSGLAAAVLKHKNGNDDQVMLDDRYHPNKLVYSKVLSALGESGAKP